MLILHFTALHIVKSKKSFLRALIKSEKVQDARSCVSKALLDEEGTKACVSADSAVTAGPALPSHNQPWFSWMNGEFNGKLC